MLLPVAHVLPAGMVHNSSCGGGAVCVDDLTKVPSYRAGGTISTAVKSTEDTDLLQT